MRRVFGLLAFLSLPLAWSAAPAFAIEEVAGFQKLELVEVGDPGLEMMVGSLAPHGLFPKPAPASIVTGDVEKVVAVELEDRNEPGRWVVLYFLPETGRYFFLGLRADPLGRPEMRLWGKGPAEIVATEEGLRLSPKASPQSVRIDPEVEKLALAGRGLEAKELTPSDIIACLARTLGITLDLTSLRNLISSTACSATNTIGLFLLANNCLSVFSVGSANVFASLGCLVGTAKLISCGAFTCTPTTEPCKSTIALDSTTAGTWATGCTSRHRFARYARYYTFSVAAATTVKIDLHSSVDSYLYLLVGSNETGRVIERDDQGGPGDDAQIVRTLSPGTYTIEATTYWPARTGSFILTLRP